MRFDGTKRLDQVPYSLAALLGITLRDIAKRLDSICSRQTAQSGKTIRCSAKRSGITEPYLTERHYSLTLNAAPFNKTALQNYVRLYKAALCDSTIRNVTQRPIVIKRHKALPSGSTLRHALKRDRAAICGHMRHHRAAVLDLIILGTT